MTACAMCEGPRGVTLRQVAGVELAVCRWCWNEYGPGRTYRGEYVDPVGAMLSGEADAAAAANERARAARLQADRTRYGKHR